MIHQKHPSLGRTASFRTLPALLIFGAAAAMTITAQAATPRFGLFNTGIDPAAMIVNGVPVSVDTHYTIAAEAPVAPLSSPTTYVTDLTNLPFSPGNTATSSFISPQPSYAAGQIDAGGVYDFTTSFDLTGVNLSLVSIQGRFESDDAILDILINGRSLGILLPDPGYRSFSNYYNLAPNASYLLSGTNTLEFRVFNFTGAVLDPVALRTEFLTAVPEPSVWASIIALGSVLLAGTWLRRRRATV